MKTIVMCLIFVMAIVLANMSVAYFGPKITPVNSFLFIGLDFSLRDALHDRWKNNNILLRMLSLFVVGGLVSYLVNPAAGMIAIASSVSFVLSNAVDGITYHKVRNYPFLVRSNTSNIGGSITDSILFPTIAFGTLMPEIIIMQFISKMSGGFVWSLALTRLRRVAA